jgi:hypothetical protein
MLGTNVNCPVIVNCQVREGLKTGFDLVPWGKLLHTGVKLTHRVKLAPRGVVIPKLLFAPPFF